jgi:hypothetical protein
MEFLEIVLRNILYIISVSCQVTGSVALAFYIFPFRRRTIVQSFFRNTFSIQDGESITYDHQLFIEHIRKSYLTWLSVITLLIGYSLQIFCIKIDDNHLILLAGVLFFSILIYAIIFLVSALMARWIGKKRVTNKELEDYQISTNISFMQEEEMIQILEEEFGKVFNEK